MSKNPAAYLIGNDDTIADVNLDELDITYRGGKLTEARAAELGEIAAREADAYEAAERQAGRAAGLIPGGKSLSGGHKHSPVVQVRVSEATRDRLATIVKARKMSISKLSRQVLDDFVKHQAV
ncbi:DNA-binding protein [Mycobacterium simiae]|uniref:DNA-binding protein n=1 Tax=Mycobacterium simiae TaxID=1784 RepID=A0A5B1BTD3_MYCSI|nr:DNA-binding protein [Mycobacterium simiae]KAA1251005.1 DNA-binding protein [Mycobacterium simiae]